MHIKTPNLSYRSGVWTSVKWQDFRYANGTLGEWVKKSDAEVAAVEAEIQQIRELLDED